MQTMAVGANGVAPAGQQSSSAYNVRANHTGGNSFQQQLAAQADVDSETDSTSSDASTSGPREANNSDSAAEATTATVEPGIVQGLKSGSATPAANTGQAATTKAAATPVTPTQKAGPNLVGIGFIGVPSGAMNSAAKHIASRVKPDAAPAGKKPGTNQVAGAANSSASDAEPGEALIVAALVVPQQSNTNEPAQADASTSTKVGMTDSQLNPASTGEPTIHAPQPPGDQNVEDVSFAVRLAPDVSSSPPPAQVAQDTASIQSLPQVRSAAGPNEPAGGQGFRSDEAALAAQQSSENKSFDKVDKAIEPASVNHDSIDQPVEPGRNLRLHFSGDGAQQVELRIIERSGAVNVSVRSTDPVLSRSLQEGIPELMNKLQADRFHAEVWLPKSAESHSSNAGDTYSSGGRGSAGGDGNPNQSGSRKNQSRPEWVDELEQLGKVSTGRKNN